MIKKNASFWAFCLILATASFACARSNRVAQATDITQNISFDSLERSYILHVPPSYDGRHVVPLVLVFHGGGGNAENVIRSTNFDSKSDEAGFIVAYPNGTGRLGDTLLTWNGGTCCGFAVQNKIDDVGFVRAVIAELESSNKIDTKRIYATGMSNGAIMSYRLACEASDLFAAIGPVSGTLNFEPCEPNQPVSVIHFHGTDDQHVPYNGGVGPDSLAGVPFSSVKDSVEFWSKFDQCPSTPYSESFSGVQHDVYTGCINGTSVELYTISGGKHAWPGSNSPGWVGGDEPSRVVSATDLIWKFFAAHPKP